MSDERYPTKHWNEIDTTREPSVCQDGLYYHLTKRAWDERFEYAALRVGEYMKEFDYKTSTSRSSFNERIRGRYKDIIMERISDGHTEPLLSPSEFGKKYNISKTGIAILVKDKKRISAYGWRVYGRV